MDNLYHFDTVRTIELLTAATLYILCALVTEFALNYVAPFMGLVSSPNSSPTAISLLILSNVMGAGRCTGEDIGPIHVGSARSSSQFFSLSQAHQQHPLVLVQAASP